ncbi:cytochrome c family protein [Salinisphaera sp. T5B8]|uniref:c-type cytochrome n=1 Tax=Salinisphaera sp. T5B8 TaxID=1304154 RepID=UPI00333FFD92
MSLLIVGGAAAGVIYSGVYNVAATSDHWPITRWALQKTVHRSVERQASGIDVPPLGSEKQLLAGAVNFDAMCSSCHTPPGAQPSAAAQGMYPEPPELTHAAREKSPGEIFWVIKHGIKASGMPAWGASHSDDDLWAMTAFIAQLPDMTPADYRQMLQTAQASGIGHGAGGHHGESGDGHPAEDANGQDHGHNDGDEQAPGHRDGSAPHSDSGSRPHAHG